MNGMRILGAVVAGILVSSLGSLVACGGSQDSKESVTTARAVSGASVRIELFDAKGTRIGDGSGVLIAPRLVLTSGSLVSGKHTWVVTSADGKQRATGSRGMTYDWMTYASNKAHPRRHDVGVIHLDESIKLDAYPRLVSQATADGTKVTRVRGTGAGFQELDVTIEKHRTSPNAWLAVGKSGETLDTGGAVYDERGILGVVSGRGTTTGKLYLARIDGLVKWLAPKVACAGGATGTRTLADPQIDKSKEICEDAGTGSGEGTSGGQNGGSGSGGDGAGSCDGNNDGVCSGTCTVGSGGTNVAHGGSESGGGGAGGTGAGGGAGGTGGDGSGGTNGSYPGGPSGGGAGGGEASEVCQGSNDNPELCPPEPVGCTGPNCGGGQPDDSIDYGNCACGSSDGEIYLR